MEKISEDKTLQHEVSVVYRDFRRDTFVVGISAFALIMIVGLIIRMGWLFSVGMGFIIMLAVISDFVIKRQLFKISFYDRDQKVIITYSLYMGIKDIEISYTDLSYYGRTYQNNIQLKLYREGKLWITTDKNKYGWTDGRVQEAIRMLSFRDIKCIK